jgi:hypothetical protein
LSEMREVMGLGEWRQYFTGRRKGKKKRECGSGIECGSGYMIFHVVTMLM